MEAVKSQLPRSGDFITGQEARPTSGEIKWYVLEMVTGEAVSQLHHLLAGSTEMSYPSLASSFVRGTVTDVGLADKCVKIR